MKEHALVTTINDYSPVLTLLRVLSLRESAFVLCLTF
jgi:hypothetical protein